MLEIRSLAALLSLVVAIVLAWAASVVVARLSRNAGSSG